MRALHPLGTLFLTLTLALLPGCSKDVERIVANERFLRGQGNIGATDRAVFDADRDTYVGVGQRNFGEMLLVGAEGAYEAEAFLRVPNWSLPTDTTAVFDSVYFAIPNDPDFIRGVSTFTIELADSAGGLGAIPTFSTPYSLGTLRVNLTLAIADSMRAWEIRRILGLPTPTFVLRAPFGGGVGGFQAGAGTFNIVYHLPATPTTFVTVSSGASIDSYTRSPLTPTPTGAETALLLGGRYETMVALRTDAPPIPAGFSLNEAAWVLHLDGVEDALEDNGFVPDKTFLDVDVYRIGANWAESATDTTGLALGASVPAFRLQQVDPATDTTLVIPIPLVWLRGWAADSTTNHGILVAFTRWRELRDVTGGSAYVPMSADISSAIRVRSRESGAPAQLRVSWTSPPPARF